MTNKIVGVRVTCEDNEYFISTRERLAGHSYKPHSLLKDPVAVLKRIAQLLDIDVEIKLKESAKDNYGTSQATR